MPKYRWFFLLSCISLTALIAGVFGARLQMKRINLAKPAVYENKLDIFLLSKFSRVSIAMLGDSLTASVPWNEILGCKDLINRGVGSSTSLDVLHRIDEVLERKPEVIVLMIGVNDVSLKIPSDQTISAINEILDKSQRNGSFLFVQFILPVSKDYPRPDINQEISALNTEIQKSLKDKIGVNLLDSRSLLSTKDGYLRDDLTIDGVHLNANGYKILRDNLTPHLEKSCR